MRLGPHSSRNASGHRGELDADAKRVAGFETRAQRQARRESKSVDELRAILRRAPRCSRFLWSRYVVPGYTTVRGLVFTARKVEVGRIHMEQLRKLEALGLIEVNRSSVPVEFFVTDAGEKVRTNGAA